MISHLFWAFSHLYYILRIFFFYYYMDGTEVNKRDNIEYTFTFSFRQSWGDLWGYTKPSSKRRVRRASRQSLKSQPKWVWFFRRLPVTKGVGQTVRTAYTTKKQTALTCGPQGFPKTVLENAKEQKALISQSRVPFIGNKVK